MVEREPAARCAAVDAAPAVTGEERPPRDLSLDRARDPHVVDEPDHVGPRVGVARRVERLVELLEHLRLALEDEHVSTSHRRDVQGLVARVEHQDLRHDTKNVATRAQFTASVLGFPSHDPLCGCLDCHRRGLRGRGGACRVGVSRRSDSARSREPARSARRRQGRPGRLRRLTPGAHRRPAWRRGRGRGRTRPGRPPGRRLDHEHLARSLRRLRGRGRAPVRLDRVPGREPLGHRGQRHPGPRLRADLREGARPRAAERRAFARGAGVCREGDGRG